MTKSVWKYIYNLYRIFASEDYMIYFIGKVFESINCFFKKLFLNIEYGKRIKFGKKVKFRKGFRVIIGKKGKLVIGDNTFFNVYCSIACFGKITIGKNNIFGENVTIYDHNHVFNQEKFDQKELKIGEVEIGNENWICSKANVSANSKVGNRCVISACYNYSNKTAEDFVLYKNGASEPIKINK